MGGLQTKAKSLLFTHHTKQILQVFVNTFLGMYFLKITDGNILKVVLYYIIYYVGHALFFYAFYKFLKLPDVISYRMSLFVKLMDCIILLALGKSIINFIYPFAVLEALAQSLYYTSYKTMTIANNRGNQFKQYFFMCRVFEGIINLVVPASLGFLLGKLGYSYIFVILSIVMLISFLLSFKVEASAKFKNTFDLKKFSNNIKDKKALRKIGFNSICYGLTDGGTLSLLLSLVIFMNYSNSTFGNYKGEDILGYLTSAVAAMSIVLSYFHKRKINSSNFLISYLPSVILTIIVAIPVSLTTKIFFLIAYRFINESIKIATTIEQDQVNYSLLPHITDKKYQREYLYYIEFMLNVGRILGMILIGLLYIITKDAHTLSYLFIVCTVFYLIFVLNINSLLKLQKSNTDNSIAIQN